MKSDLMSHASVGRALDMCDCNPSCRKGCYVIPSNARNRFTTNPLRPSTPSSSPAGVNLVTRVAPRRIGSRADISTSPPTPLSHRPPFTVILAARTSLSKDISVRSEARALGTQNDPPFTTAKTCQQYYLINLLGHLGNDTIPTPSSPPPSSQRCSCPQRMSTRSPPAPTPESPPPSAIPRNRHPPGSDPSPPQPAPSSCSRTP